MKIEGQGVRMCLMKGQINSDTNCEYKLVYFVDNHNISFQVSMCHHRCGCTRGTTVRQRYLLVEATVQSAPTNLHQALGGDQDLVGPLSCTHNYRQSLVSARNKTSNMCDQDVYL